MIYLKKCLKKYTDVLLYPSLTENNLKEEHMI